MRQARDCCSSVHANGYGNCCWRFTFHHLSSSGLDPAARDPIGTILKRRHGQRVRRGTKIESEISGRPSQASEDAGHWNEWAGLLRLCTARDDKVVHGCKQVRAGNYCKIREMPFTEWCQVITGNFSAKLAVTALANPGLRPRLEKAQRWQQHIPGLHRPVVHRSGSGSNLG